MDLQHFDLPVAVTLRLQSRSGKIEVVAEPREDVVVEGEKFDVSEADDGATMEVRAGYAGSKPGALMNPENFVVLIRLINTSGISSRKRDAML